jgi:hypothetical protein
MYGDIFSFVYYYLLIYRYGYMVCHFGSLNMVGEFCHGAFLQVFLGSGIRCFLLSVQLLWRKGVGLVNLVREFN